jgi:hypothetical protein
VGSNPTPSAIGEAVALSKEGALIAGAALARPPYHRTGPHVTRCREGTKPNKKPALILVRLPVGVGREKGGLLVLCVVES